VKDRRRKDIIDNVPRFIVNAAAIANVDRCEHEREVCWRVNVDGVENIIGGAKKAGAKVIHFSTDFGADTGVSPRRVDQTDQR